MPPKTRRSRGSIKKKKEQAAAAAQAAKTAKEAYDKGYRGAGYTPPSVRQQQSKDRGTYTPPPDDGKVTETKATQEQILNAKNKKAEEKALLAAQKAVDWWEKNGQGYRKYGDRKNIFGGGGVRNSKEQVAEKIAKKLANGNYKIEYTKLKMADGTVQMVPIITHSTGTIVNPYSGHIINTAGPNTEGGGYQTETARALGVSQDNAGVFTTEYQKGAGIPISEMKPEHALKVLMRQRPQAFQDFFSMAKQKKDFNPFSFSTISTIGNALFSAIRGDIGLVVGNNLKRNGWGEAVENEDGTYSIKFTEKGAKNWSETFKVPDYVTPEAVLKDQSKGFLGEILGTKKFAEIPVDLKNLIDVGGTTTLDPPINPLLDPTNPDSRNFNVALNDPFILQEPKMEIIPYNFARPMQGPTGPETGPEFTPDGFRISAFNPTVDYRGSLPPGRGADFGTGQQTGGGGGGSGGGTTNQGGLTFDMFGRPIKYDYTGGPEQIMLGGGFKRDGQYIGSPYGFSEGGIANFRGYGY